VTNKRIENSRYLVDIVASLTNQRNEKTLRAASVVLYPEAVGD
jgi:hypothetical protein